MSIDVSRAAFVRSGVRLEVLTVTWMVIEAVASLAAGILAGSALLTAFGIDSLLELFSGAILLRRLLEEAREGDTEGVERVEHRAARLVAIALTLLCVYVLLTAVYGLVTRSQPESSILGIAVSVAAVLVMPILAMAKRRIAKQIDSAALRGDAASSFTCAYMATAVLLGIGLNALLGWWWAEDIAALVFLFWLVGETREAFEEAGSEREET